MMAGNSVTLLESAVLGVVQGLTEFLPISSSAHLRVLPVVFGLPDPGAAYTAVIQLGSVVAVIAYFWKDLIGLATGSFLAIKNKDLDSHELRLSAGIIFGTIPICVIGLLLKGTLESPDSPLRALWLVGAASIVMGLLLVVAEKLGTQKRTLHNMGLQDGLLVGIGQALSLIPGCSRSGSTLTVAMLLGLNRPDAARFSFLLGIPAIVLSGILELKEMLSTGLGDAGYASLGVGLVVSAIVSYLSIAWLIKFLQNHSTWCFVIYRLIFGAYVLALGLSVVPPLVH